MQLKTAHFAATVTSTPTLSPADSKNSHLCIYPFLHHPFSHQPIHPSTHISSLTNPTLHRHILPIRSLLKRLLTLIYSCSPHPIFSSYILLPQHILPFITQLKINLPIPLTPPCILASFQRSLPTLAPPVYVVSLLAPINSQSSFSLIYHMHSCHNLYAFISSFYCPFFYHSYHSRVTIFSSPSISFSFSFNPHNPFLYHPILSILFC